MNKVFPLTDWSLEAMRPSLTTIIRRLDKLFSKMHKSVKLYQAVEWKAAGGLLNAIYITLWKHPYIVNVPNLKSLIGTCQCLVVGEDSLTSLTDHHGPSGRRPELPPQNFCSVVFKLVALQVTFSRSSKILLKERIITVRAAANEREFSSQDFSFFSLSHICTALQKRKNCGQLYKSALLFCIYCNLQ